MVLDDAAFFAKLRKVTGPLDQVQVDTITAMRNAAVDWSPAWLAYGLATAWHEARFKPQDEWGKGQGHAYGQPGKHGQGQYGRGLVQLTWDRNYEAADAGLGLNGALLADFALANRPDIAARILVWGMAGGKFTGVGLGRFLPDRLGTHWQFVAARKIINGSDRADLIAGYADKMQDALIVGGWK
jgi:hypothetical protein